ncbi:succinate dehydrogenase assembly factor 1, mitochondrial-like [Patiria miniata]|uniref:Complex 1 LYR protein domain-containing protein n=1 Tax=Patiria miniata TaxID=46514 RepID=A0A914B6H0_PATMI|nr:succinate dehydrogenase assembly factor 1, mitochondrial-like [Patiria miniata]XP_038071718.1 succinate dehydrogenase assembly factor 1, mitochondrial-like [Patiria miniata]XP_038071719.1 succinate dehydrogenase assembly factor 1, mitochondrial-like [Patiria miniata]
MAGRHSRLQRQILQLYKQFLRLAEQKPGLDAHVRQEFRRWAALERTDVQRIEYLLRRGQRQLGMLQTGGVDRAGSFVKEKDGQPASTTSTEKS